MDRETPKTVVTYRIRVMGKLDPRWSAWFEGFEVVPGEGDTVLVGEIVDQAALHGLLARIRDMNLVLLSLERRD